MRHETFGETLGGETDTGMQTVLCPMECCRTVLVHVHELCAFQHWSAFSLLGMSSIESQPCHFSMIDWWRNGGWVGILPKKIVRWAVGTTCAIVWFLSKLFVCTVVLLGFVAWMCFHILRRRT